MGRSTNTASLGWNPPHSEPPTLAVNYVRVSKADGSQHRAAHVAVNVGIAEVKAETRFRAAYMAVNDMEPKIGHIAIFRTTCLGG